MTEKFVVHEINFFPTPKCVFKSTNATVAVRSSVVIIHACLFSSSFDHPESKKSHKALVKERLQKSKL